jgi:hypothetical protein
MMNHVGNYELLRLAKTAFLCSRQVPASIVLKSFDWAIQQREAGRCIISGFHSQIEKDVLHYLLKGKQPLIVALARGIKKSMDVEFKKPLANNRFLIITPFGDKIICVTQETAIKRNEFMVELAEELFVAYAQPDGNVENLVLKQLKKGKKVSTFDLIESDGLIKAGAKKVYI